MVASLSFGSHDEIHVILLGDDKDRMKFYPTYVDWNKRKFAPFHAHSVDLDASRLGDLFRANSTFDGFSPGHTCNIDSECHASSVCHRFKCQSYDVAVGEKCKANASCRSGRCERKSFRQSTCQPKLKAGERCNENADCLSNSCRFRGWRRRC